jgi:acetolactate synthase-1/2/3 large subunit
VHQVDAEPLELERSRRALGERLRLTALADAKSALLALTGAACSGASAAWRDDVRCAVAYRPAAWNDARAKAPDRLHPVQMLRPLQAVLDGHPDSVLVCDGGEIGQWATACLSAPHRVINGVAGSIGSGLPFALAARSALPGAPVLAVMGDGTVGFHVAEFDTALRYRLPFVCVVGNDARWNAEYQIQLRDYGAGRLIGCELLPTRYDAVARAFGGHGEHVGDAAGMAPALERALGSGLPSCVNVMIEGLAAPQIRR